MFRILGLAAALLLTMTTPARAQLRAISDGATPVLSGARVLWAPAGAARVRVLARQVRIESVATARWAGRLCGFEPPRRGRAGHDPRRRGGTRVLRVGRGPVRVGDSDGRARTVFDGS